MTESPLENPDDTRKPRLLFLTAREQEHARVLNEFPFEKKLHQNHPYFRFQHDAWEIRLTRTGIGPEQARSTLAKLEGLLDPDFVLISGTAGSLSEDLARNSVYLPTAVRMHESEDWYHPETDVLHWLMNRIDGDGENEFPVRSGPLVTVDEPVTDQRTRKSIRESNRALAVDMESAAILEAFLNDSSDPPRWGVLRTISDTPEDSSLPDVKARQSRAANHNARRLVKLLSSILED